MEAWQKARVTSSRIHFPETFNRIQVRTIAWQGDHREAQFRSRRLHTLALVPRGAVPDEHDLTRLITKPGGDMPQELDRMGLVTDALVPDETLASGEIVGTVPVDAFSQGATAAQTPGGFAFGRPRVAQVHAFSAWGERHAQMVVPHGGYLSTKFLVSIGIYIQMFSLMSEFSSWM